ncbi:hypothetical protein ACFVVA_16765 [Kitasatospora sp. NPDC058048]|uniref:hypothetical protein n=1 Tax=Kitasatospora sp. NPDC058048 TaxID=3346313 RepID=UPI0036DB272B
MSPLLHVMVDGRSAAPGRRKSDGLSRFRPERGSANFGVGDDTLPPDHQRILAIVRDAGGPVAVKQVGEELGLEVAVWGKLEPLRGKLSKLAGPAAQAARRQIHHAPVTCGAAECRP